LSRKKLIGDADSADPEAWEWAYGSGSQVLKYEKDKNLTDFQLALDLLSEETARQKKGVFLTGCFGGRFDHLWSTFISFLKRSDRYVPIGMADEKEGLMLIDGPDFLELYFKKKTGSSITHSIFRFMYRGFNKRVRWPLDNVRLEYCNPYSISNRLESEKIIISADSGRLGVYWEWCGAAD